MRLFKPRYEYIWDSAIEEYSNRTGTEKDWNKIDLVSSSKLTRKHREVKKRIHSLEEMLHKLTEKYEENQAKKVGTSEILAYMTQVIDRLKVEYFFLHSLQEIILIRDLISETV